MDELGVVRFHLAVISVNQTVTGGKITGVVRFHLAVISVKRGLTIDISEV